MEWKFLPLSDCVAGFPGVTSWGVTLINRHCFYICVNSPSWYALKSRGTTPESQKDWRDWCSKPNIFPYGCRNEKFVWALVCSGKAAAEVDGWRPGPVSSPRHPSFGVNPTPRGQTHTFSVLWSAEIFPINSILLEWLTALLELLWKMFMCIITEKSNPMQVCKRTWKSTPKHAW